MNWSDVGNWIKDNAGTGAALVGSLLTGNVPGAVAAGVSLVSGATGTDDPTKALQALQLQPQALVRLKELYNQNEADIRRHLETMERQRLEDKQAEHHEAQETIRAGDRADDRFVRWTRPGQSWASLFASFAYVGLVEKPDVQVLLAWLALPYAYAGLRQLGKLANVVSDTVSIVKNRRGK